jgi:hypothetical protein
MTMHMNAVKQLSMLKHDWISTMHVGAQSLLSQPSCHSHPLTALHAFAV